MGVNQSSATTATDTGAGTAVAPVSGAEATAELNVVTIRRLRAVYVAPPAGGPALSRSASPQEAQPTPQRSSDAGVDTALTTLRALGYRLSTPAREALIHAEQA